MRIITVGLVAAIALVAWAGPNSPTTAPASGKSVRLTLPWKNLTSLSTEQKIKIAAIHKKSLEQQKAIKAAEKAEILSLLTQEQKLELIQMQENDTVVKKLINNPLAPTTAPAE